MTRHKARSASLCLLLLFGPGLAGAVEVDLSGNWNITYHEDWIEIGTGPDIADYAGLPVTPEAAQRALNWHASLVNVPERQCMMIPMEYANRWSNLRVWKEIEPSTQKLISYRFRKSWGGTDRFIWMDKRPRPPKGALHSFEGFSLGEIVGDKLKITTTHLKEGYSRRNGVPRSDRAEIVENYLRHGEFLTISTVIVDPVYLTEPLVVSSNYKMNSAQKFGPYPCESVTELVSMDVGYVPHYFPWKNPHLTEFSNKYKIPLKTSLGGADQMYPSFIE